MKAKIVVNLCLLAVTSRGQNLLINGSFELPTLTAQSFGLSVHPGDTNLTGWTVGGTNCCLGLFRGLGVLYPFLAADGAQFVEFDRGNVLSQSFPTVPGEVYEARFSVGRYQGTTNMQVLASILSDAGGVLAHTEVAMPAAQGWNAPTSFRFTATTTLSVLRFAETNSTGNLDLTLDAVSVERVSPRMSIACSQVRLCWESRTNASYQLQYRSESTTNMWTDLGTPIPGTNGVDCTVQPVEDPYRFYRVILVP